MPARNSCWTNGFAGGPVVYYELKPRRLKAQPMVLQLRSVLDHLRILSARDSWEQTGGESG